MDQFNFLSKLSAFEPNGSPFISVYLNTEPNGNGKKEFGIFLKKQLSEHEFPFEQKPEELEKYQADAQRITEFTENLDPATRGAAVFASSQSGFFQTFEFEVPFPENLFFISDRPRLYPLVQLYSQNSAFAVVQADTNSANTFVFQLGRTIREGEIQNTKTNRSEVGGWSQMRYQRHVDNFHQQHAKEVVAELDKLITKNGIDRVVLAGDETVIIPILRAEFSKELEEKIVGVLSLNVDAPEHEVYEAALEAVKKFDAEEDKQKIDNLIEHDYDGGTGVTGVHKTIAALMNGQVQELYLTGNIDSVSFKPDSLQEVLSAYQADTGPAAPDLTDPGSVIDELIKLAAASADSIRFIEDERLLKKDGGVGALLRYQAKGVSNI